MNQRPISLLLRSITQISPIVQFSQTIQPASHYINSNLYQAQQYFSSFRYSTEDQLIDQIHSLGDQINSIIIAEQQLSLSKEKRNRLNIVNNAPSLLAKSVEKFNSSSIERQLNTSTQKVNKNHHHHLNKNNRTSNITKHTKQPKYQPTKQNKYSTIKPNVTPFLIDNNKSKQKIYNKYQTHKNHHHKQASQQSLKTQHNKLTPKVFEQTTQPSYHKFIQKNINKLVKQLQSEKELLQPTNTNVKNKKPNNITMQQKRPNNIKNRLNQTQSFNHSLILQQSLSKSRQKMNQTMNSALFENSHKMQQRKQEKIQKYRQQKIHKELLQTTFQPSTYTSNYRSKNQFVNEKKNLKNFIKRQQADKQLRRKNHFKQLKQVMQECSFKPRLNVVSRHSQSIVKEIWDSSSLEKRNLKKSLQRKSIQKFKDNYQSTLHNNLSIQQRRSIDNSFQHSKRSTIFNQSTQISVQDCKELSFLLK